MLIAMLPSDESNLVAAQVVHTLFNIPIKIVRLEATTYIQNSALFSDTSFPVDSIISPQKLVAENIKTLIRYPGTLEVAEFVSGRLVLFAAPLSPNSKFVGTSIEKLSEADPNLLFSAVYRDDRLLDDDSAPLMAGDEIYCVAEQSRATGILRTITNSSHENKRIFIGGGGNCGMHLARLLTHDYHVKLFERDPARATFLSRMLDKAIVVCASANDEDTLRQENIKDSDVFCSLTSDDEDNIMSAILARSLGVKCVMSLVGQPSYVKLVDKMVDIAISPQEYSIGPLLSQTRESDIVAVRLLRHGQSEVIEVVAHGAPASSRVVGRKISEISWPKAMHVAAVVRGDKILMPKSNTADTVVENDDHLLLFIDGLYRVGEVEKLFRVSATFL